MISHDAMTHAQRKKRNAGCRRTISRPLLDRRVNFVSGGWERDDLGELRSPGHSSPRFAFSPALTDLFTMGSLLAPLISWLRPKPKERAS
jgi:hypothetical protein